MIRSGISEKVSNVTFEKLTCIAGQHKEVIPIPNLVIISTPSDGSCFFHSVLRAFNRGYIKATSQSQRTDISRLLRDSLATEFAEIDPDTDSSYYNGFGRGNLATLGSSCNEYRMDYLQKTLRSNDMVGHEFLESICKFLRIDVYIIFDKTHDVYPLGNDLDLYYKNRSSIVLYFYQSSQNSGHYEVVGLLHEDGSIGTLFNQNHHLIKSIQERYGFTFIPKMVTNTSI